MGDISAQPEPAAGQGLPSHWDPSNPNDLVLIASFQKRHKRRFAKFTEKQEDLVVEMVELSAECAKRMAKAAVEVGDIGDAGKLAALSATVGKGIVQVQQSDDHHADDLEVAKANAVTGAMNAMNGVRKTYLGLDEKRV